MQELRYNAFKTFKRFYYYNGIINKNTMKNVTLCYYSTLTDFIIQFIIQIAHERMKKVLATLSVKYIDKKGI